MTLVRAGSTALDLHVREATIGASLRVKIADYPFKGFEAKRFGEATPAWNNSMICSPGTPGHSSGASTRLAAHVCALL